MDNVNININTLSIAVQYAPVSDYWLSVLVDICGDDAANGINNLRHQEQEASRRAMLAELKLRDADTRIAELEARIDRMLLDSVSKPDLQNQLDAAKLQIEADEAELIRLRCETSIETPRGIQAVPSVVTSDK